MSCLVPNRTLLIPDVVKPSTRSPKTQSTFFTFQHANCYSRVASTSLSHRSGRGRAGGAFYDTARCGTIRGEGILAPRESMFPESTPNGTPDSLLSPSGEPKARRRRQALLHTLVKTWTWRCWKLPLVALSYVQMKRAQVARGVLREPNLMLLDEL